MGVSLGKLHRGGGFDSSRPPFNVGGHFLLIRF
jgi:hypothetical protein